MAKFVIEITTKTNNRPVSRGEEILEIRRIEQVIVVIASHLSSCGLSDGGDVTGIEGVRATYSYSVESPRKVSHAKKVTPAARPSETEMPPAA